MKHLILVLALVAASCAREATPDQSTDVARWERRAESVTIIRDDWGIPHVYGSTDADTVFGVMYAQAEDDFNRVETNYLNSMGRLAEAEGESAIYRDLRMKLFIDPAEMQALYRKSPEWLKALMDAYADGLNYYLHKNPHVRPRVITRFEPWMALSFSEGSIGGDIERVNLRQLEAFYGGAPAAHATPTTMDTMDTQDHLLVSSCPSCPLCPSCPDREPRGSNGIAIAPSNTADGKSLLLINPHTSFFFRAEAKMVSDEGLHAYGAITWGQFFIYQGFNDRTGWMHTSSSVDNIDEYAETIIRKGDSVFYQYGSEERPVTARTIVVPYKSGEGVAQKAFTVYRTHHGPIVREADGKWIAVRLMEEPLKALMQSYSRTKARNYAAFRETMELHTNSSNNTIYADADGTIAYFHSNFIPRRDEKLDWTRPVDGSDPATEWNGLLSIDETPGLRNPSVGWLYNTNNHPWSAAGADSPQQDKFPPYVDRGGENARGVHAIRVLENQKDFTLDKLIEAAYSSYLPAFAERVPPLIKAYDALPASDPLKKTLAEQIALLRGWDYRWSTDSVPTAVAVFWGEEAGRSNAKTPQQLLEALAAASDRLQADFGNWKTPWGNINRYQRLTGDIVQPFDDAGPSIPVGFTSARWGSLASFGARTYPGTKKMYGTSGNSFVAVVEFGDRVRAKAITAGGQSGDPKSPHFGDQAERYARGELRDVYFYREQLQGHTKREYRPGQ
ncbi:MAG TPA: acylase [Vicinamibacterales bacterium]|nr:acylase [Vicinamibacterales bacterium]